MSESTPPTKLDKAVSNLRLKGGAEGRYWLASLIGHIVVIGLVVWLTPVREMIFEKEKPTKAPVKTRGEELDEVMEEVRVQIADKIRERVNLLNDGQVRMADNYETFQGYYNPFFEDQLESALDRFESHAARALEGLTSLERHLKRAVEEGEYSGLMAEGSALQSRISTSQREIRRGMVLLKADEEAILAEQTRIEEAQWELGPRLREIQRNVEWVTVSAPQRLTRIQEELAERETAVADAESELEEKREVLEAMIDRQKRLREDLKKAEAVLADEDADPEQRKLAEERKEELETSRGAQQSRKRDLNNTEKGVERAVKSVGNREKDRRNTAQTLEDWKEEMEERRVRLETVLEEFLADQSRLHVQQRDLIEKVRSLAREKISEERSS